MLADLRALRLWHYREALYRRDIARQQESNGQTELMGIFDKIADQHIKFVQTLNDFFPTTDNSAQDDEKEKAAKQDEVMQALSDLGQEMEHRK